MTSWHAVSLLVVVVSPQLLSLVAVLAASWPVASAVPLLVKAVASQLVKAVASWLKMWPLVSFADAVSLPMNWLVASWRVEDCVLHHARQCWPARSTNNVLTLPQQ